jgi:2-polyprenyl-3-methyl-5-hydroxy-6-metoxy-1,4-benzoquinol methylase
MDLMTTVACPACANVGDPLRRTGYEQDIEWFKCRACKSEYLAPQPTDDRLMQIYGSEYYEPWAWEDEDVVHRSKRRTFLRALDQVTVTPTTRLLDVGCAQGEFAAAAVKRCGNVAGVDLNPQAIAIARAHVPDATFFCGELAPEVVGPGWDVITMFDFIEHVRSPVETLSAAASVLASNGQLLISTPRVDSTAHRMLRTHWPQYREEHLVLFSVSGLERALRTAGLLPVRMVPTVKYCTLAYLWGQAQAYSGERVKHLATRSRPILALPPTHWDLPLRFGEMTVAAQLA